MPAYSLKQGPGGSGVSRVQRPIARWISVYSLLAICILGVLAQSAGAQAVADTGAPPTARGALISSQSDLAYVRPTRKTEFQRYLFNMFGPYPLAGAAIVGGISQAYNTPPEWRQGAEGYGKRFGSTFGIEAASTTSRYVLAEAFKEDTLYYRCECKGLFPRLRHAVISTLTARRGEDGHVVFSLPSLIAPYAGTTTAVYAWYPKRFDYKDAFRMGNYTMLGYVGANIGLEFLYSGPHSLLSRMHLANSQKSQTPPTQSLASNQR